MKYLSTSFFQGLFYSKKLEHCNGINTRLRKREAFREVERKNGWKQRGEDNSTDKSSLMFCFKEKKGEPSLIVISSSVTGKETNSDHLQLSKYFYYFM